MTRGVSLGDNGEGRADGRISSISFLKKARTRQWGCYTRPELFGTLEIACDLMKNSGGDWFCFKCLPICKCYRLVSFPLNYYDRQLLFPCCDMYGERGRRGVGGGEHESPISCKFRTEENSTWWHMARKDDKDVFQMVCPKSLPTY